MTSFDIDSLYNKQLPVWSLARCNYAQLDNAETRTINFDGTVVKVQHNPTRITSATSAPQKHQEGACFLCNENLPVEQIQLPYLDGKYKILVNPYPIFHRHFTIPATIHTPQRIDGRIKDMMQLAQDCTPYTIFYNGPRCGASAPMHMHFQAAQAGFLPIEQQWKENRLSHILRHNSGELCVMNDTLRNAFIINAHKSTDAEYLFDRLYHALPQVADEEPMMNVITRYEDDKWIIMVFPRVKHRPDCYYAQDHTQRVVSPGTVEMGGVIITPRQSDFEQLTAQEIKNIYAEISMPLDETDAIISQIKMQQI